MDGSTSLWSQLAARLLGPVDFSVDLLEENDTDPPALASQHAVIAAVDRPGEDATVVARGVCLGLFTVVTPPPGPAKRFV